MFKLMLALVLMIVVMASAATALDFDQKQFYGQGVLALPIGDWSDFANLGIGAGVGLLVPHSAEMAFRGEISYIHFMTDDVEGADYSFSMIPINVLLQYNMESVYLLGGLGLTFAKSEVEVDSEFGDFSGSSTDSELGLVLGAGFDLSPSMMLEGRFNIVSDANYLSANLGFRF
ncbi:MAG: outer membrane beta-barrel protein [Krumholzibacteria bacterium]|nr:outer membrane beta-barrel protein [Candidatus Krumholzibacteria bacterium]